MIDSNKKKKEEEVSLPKEKEKKAPKRVLPSWNFPLKKRSVRARTLKEATEKIKSKK